jgi:DNA gyrase inhibitor GyrI
MTEIRTAEEMQKAWNEIFPYLIKNGYNIELKPIIERGILLLWF